MPLIGRNPPTTPSAQVDAYIAAADPAVRPILQRNWQCRCHCGKIAFEIQGLATVPVQHHNGGAA